MLEEKEFDFKFLTRRSRCNQCSASICTIALIPILGFLYSKGKCLKCHNPIPFTYFYNELLLSILFILPSLVYIQFRDFNLYYLLIIFLVPLAIYDAIYFKIPNFLLSVLLITGLYLTNFNYINLFDDLVIILLIHFIYYLFQNQIGYGDIKLLCVLTLITPTLMFSFIVLLSYIVGGFYVIIVELIKTTNYRKLPYVPFIMTSTILTFISYDDLTTIYFGGFL